MIFTLLLVQKHLQPRVHRPAIKTRYSFCRNIFQKQFKCLPNIWEDFILQDFNASEPKRLPNFIFLKIQYSLVIILPKYINHLDNWNIKMNDSDNCRSNPRRKRGKKKKKKNSEFLQHQETPHKGPPNNDWEGQGQQDQLETPSKKMKVKDGMEASTTPEEMKDKRLNTISISENTSTSLDNTVKQENIFSSVQNKAENDTQHDKDHNKDKYYVKNEVSGIISYSGLVNQGATCYLNAVLQTLFMTKKFRNAIMKLNESEMKSVSFALKKLFSRLESNNGSATTNEVTNALGIGNVCEQQDAAEYYQMILSMIEPESAKVFQGNKKHLTTCTDGNHDPIVEIISFFSLPIAMDSDLNNIDVQKSFEAQFEVMLMDGEDQLYCENCKSMMDMEMRCIISELPDVLTLHLQRFYMDYSYMTYKKNNCRVKIPLQLSAQEERDVLHDYELYAVVNHVGSLSGGHYYADIKSFKCQQWYRFNDSTVNSIHQKYDKKRHFISDEACMLFFRKSSKQHTHKVKAENDTQHDKDHNKDEYYVKNEVSGIISYSGLVNQGATCYLNAVLQTLFMTKKFRNAIMKLNESEMKSVSFALKKLFSCLESNNGSATTNEVTNALGIGNVCEQQDAAEYYQMILSMIEPEPAKVFQGNKKHLTTCTDGNHDPIVEIISFFSLPIAMDSDLNNIDVQKSFEAQFEVMLMDGEDQLYCENCKSMMDMEMRCIISELPDVLTLHLQRFYMDYSYMTYKKNNCRVKIPLQLSAQEERDVLHDYELYAVVNHVGSLSGGHYYADIKSFKCQQWYRFNDSTVNSIHQKYKKQHFISDEACMLFFRKSSKQHTHKVNVEQERPVPRSDESEGLQTKMTSSPEDSINLPHQDTEHISTDTENNLESIVSSEKDMHPSDSSTENELNSPQTMTADVEMQSADHDDQSTPSISSNAEVSIPSAKPAIMSDNSLKETTVEKTPDTTLRMVQQPNHPSPDIQEFTEVSQSTYTRPGELTQRANTWPQEVCVKLLSRRYSECESPQTNTRFQIWMKPEDSLPHQDTEHISTETENNHESTVGSEKDMQALLNPSDSSTENESNPPQTMTPEPEEDNHPSLADIQDSEITGTTLLEVSHFTYTRPEQLTQRANTCPKEDHVKLPSSRRYSECKSPQTNTSIQIRMKPEDSLPHQDRDHLSTDTENATDADYDDQPTFYIHGRCVNFTKERQRMDPEPHVTTHNESDSDNDNPEAQRNSLLEQTTVRRRKIQRRMFFLFGFFLFGLFLCLILVFVFTLPF